MSGRPRRQMKNVLVVASALALGAAAYHATAQNGDQPPQGQPPAGGAPNPMEALGQRLIGALQASEGCLGTEIANTNSGKAVIFAWFENAEAARDWYHSPAHRGAMNMFMRGQKPAGEPLEHITDEDAPVMVIASITPADAELPIRQIAIEMYTPLPGGTAVNGRFAPEAMDVPHLRRHCRHDDVVIAGR